MTAPAAASPLISSAPGWPLVVYFHHVHPGIDHYTSISPASFRYGLELLLEHFTPLSLGELMTARYSRCLPDTPSMVVTFDDGYADLLDDAVPELDRLGVRAAFFVCTSLLGRKSALPRQNYLSWPDASELMAAGHTIASHGRTHRSLDGLSAAEADGEVAGSLTALRERLGIRHALYAYPYGIVRPVPARVDGFARRLTAFGTVKSDPRAWDQVPLEVRRTYLPARDEAAWPGLVRRWLRNWKESR